MLAGYHPIAQAALGTLFTWALTAAGSAFVFIFSSGQRNILDGSLGFAAGVMIAASYWSLLDPAIDMARTSGSYGSRGQYAFLPVALGFLLGAAFVYGADKLMSHLGFDDPTMLLAREANTKRKDSYDRTSNAFLESAVNHSNYERSPTASQQLVMRKRTKPKMDAAGDRTIEGGRDEKTSWKRILLLIVAITIHNIPEGLAVGVGFGAIGTVSTATFESARNLAIGIGIQNFPEGLAVSLPLRASGMSVWKSFWFGQLSGLVEPVAGVLGACAVLVAQPLLPYALAFAAGAMIYVVVDDIIPEAQTCGNSTLASWGAICGFIVMMVLDVGLG